MTDRILLIGAGIAALCAARALQQAGRRVALIDPQPGTGGASFGNGGFISSDSFLPGAQPGMLRKVPGWLMDPLGPLAIRPLAMLGDAGWYLRWLRAGQRQRMLALSHSLHQLHRSAFEDWQQLLGAEVYGRHIRRDGEMLLYDSEAPGPGEAEENRLAAAWGLRSETLGRAELERLYPGLAPAVRRGVVKLGNGHTLSPAGLCQALIALLSADGAEFLTEQVLKIIPEPGGHLVLTNCGNHRAADVVVSAGVWSRGLLAPLGLTVPLTSQRGYHAMLPAGAAEIGMPFIHRGRGVGMTPMTEGLRVAGTVEFGGIDGLPNEARVDQALAHARQLFPHLAETRPETVWTGQRPSTPDSLPIVGRIKGHPGLWTCFGSGAYGVTQSPPAARLLTDLVLARPPRLAAADFALARFA